MQRTIAILGSTGSIGTQGLEIVRELGLPVSALTCRSNIALLAEQILEFRPGLVSVGDSRLLSSSGDILSNKFKLKASDQPEILTGNSGLETAAALRDRSCLGSGGRLCGSQPGSCCAGSGQGYCPGQ